MKTTPEFNTGIAWDNFDRFVETKSGKDTLHDTVGIAYQMRDEPMTNLTTLSTNDQFNSYAFRKIYKLYSQLTNITTTRY